MKKFRSVKILRSHIEQIPIPYADDAAQHTIIGIIDSILGLSGELNPNSDAAKKDLRSQIEKLYFELDDEKWNYNDFCIVVIKIVQSRNQGKDCRLSCTRNRSSDGVNRFWLLKK